jgi:hypothetical protein
VFAIVGASLALGTAVLVLAGSLTCFEPTIEVTNKSASLVTNVVISGTGFSENLGALDPGSYTTRTVSSGAESNLSLSFTVAGSPRTLHDLAYIESCGGYLVHLTIRPDHSVAATQEFFP